jgi:hypothetical protein
MLIQNQFSALSFDRNINVSQVIFLIDFSKLRVVTELR